MLTLMDALDCVQEVPSDIATCDLSSFFGQEFVIEWQRPCVADYYRAGDDAMKLKEQFPRWPISLCVQVAKISAFHLSPQTGGLAPGLFYADLANARNPNIWHYVELCFRNAFPEYQDATGVEQLKKLLTTRGNTQADGGDSAAPAPLADSEGDDTRQNSDTSAPTF